MGIVDTSADVAWLHGSESVSQSLTVTLHRCMDLIQSCSCMSLPICLGQRGGMTWRAGRLAFAGVSVSRRRLLPAGRPAELTQRGVQLPASDLLSRPAASANGTAIGLSSGGGGGGGKGRAAARRRRSWRWWWTQMLWRRWCGDGGGEEAATGRGGGVTIADHNQLRRLAFTRHLSEVCNSSGIPRGDQGNGLARDALEAP